MTYTITQTSNSWRINIDTPEKASPLADWLEQGKDIEVFEIVHLRKLKQTYLLFQYAYKVPTDTFEAFKQFISGKIEKFLMQ